VSAATHAAPITVGYGMLDADDDRQADEYEEHFYRGYSRLRDNTLVRLIWDWDDDRQRVRTRIPYEDQVIYTERDGDGCLVAAMAVSLGYPADFQSEGFGFAPPGGAVDAGGRYCEILNMMTTPHQRATARAMYGSFVRGFGFSDLVGRGFEVAYSTCTQRRLRTYERAGARPLARASISGEDRFFLHWPIRDLAS